MSIYKIVSLCIKAIVVVAAVWGISLCAFDPNAFMGGKTVWQYFTIQSNAWMALVALIGAVLMLLFLLLVGRLYIFIHQKINPFS